MQKKKKECVIKALWWFFGGVQTSYVDDVCLRMTKKALLGVMAALHALIALSDRANQHKSFPLNVIGQCNKLQAS